VHNSTFFPLLIGCLLLASAPLCCRAQISSTVPRYYGGIAAYSSFYQFIGNAWREQNFIPLEVIAGYRLRPRLAVQGSVAYSGWTSDNAFTGFHNDYSGSRGTYYSSVTRSSIRNTALLALARYSLTRKLAHRVQFDLIGGLTLEQTKYYDSGTYIDSLYQAPVSTSYENAHTYRHLLLTAGPSIRVRLGQHLELFHNFLFNRLLFSNDPRPYHGLSGSETLGLHYRFGQPKL
jgi:hypothetical protein